MRAFQSAANAASRKQNKQSPLPTSHSPFDTAQTSAHLNPSFLSSYPSPQSRSPSPRNGTPSTKARDLRPRPFRSHLASRPLWWIAALALLALAALWIGRAARGAGRPAKLTARDFELGPVERLRRERSGLGVPDHAPDEVVLVLCPMKDAIEHIWHFFHMLDSLAYPRHLLQVGILVSDSSDGTYARALELADERQLSRKFPGGAYDRISVFNKDFRVAGEGGAAVGGGADRHKFEVQVDRRKLMARSRTWLLSSAMRPEVDWVMWMDVDIVDYAPTLVQDMLVFAEDEQGDVVVPNCVWKTYNEQGPYDRNNWQETPASLAYKATLSPSDVLLEGYQAQLNTHRLNMADMFPPTDSTPSTLLLDGVGGCTALVRAGLHRQGAIFPAFPVDHQLETEGFAQMAKALGGRLVGLPKYYVYHGLYG